MPTSKSPKNALDLVIRKSRVHLYKPIQIAEILFHHRTEKGWNLKDLESYRNISKRWRDDISSLLVGRRSTSSQKYQDNVFESNAMPPLLLAQLAKINKAGGGFIEAYIYKALEIRLRVVQKVEKYIKSSTEDSFKLRELISLFQREPGLKRSIDKMYEILVYALFSAIVRALKAQVVLEIKNTDKEILKDFQKFIEMVLGIKAGQTSLAIPAALYRVGVTNAADRGLDIWANFGPAIQVKHLTLTPELVDDIIEEISADRIVVVCLDPEKAAIETLLKQVGWNNRIQGIITISDLENWYSLCLNKKYRAMLGLTLLKDAHREFELEFPVGKEILPFIKKRGYNLMALPSAWQIECLYE